MIRKQQASHGNFSAETVQVFFALRLKRERE